ncbi:hypothetical protein K8P03_10840 [Anaerococcus murdochii]|uniref:Uncharacterized protein n=1 Tax=Anaerococcus murdochii TaxID=411577 RepID=A0ABS7T1U3_9FIRM|nr:hypothetical protein [Anaerococcus murdochii]MBZ2387768.1 hypothetical protein [Anaerococcus murdochii]
MGVKIYNPVDLKDIEDFKTKFYGKEVTDTKKYEALKKEMDDLKGQVDKTSSEIEKDDIPERLTNLEVALSEMMGGGE